MHSDGRQSAIIFALLLPASAQTPNAPAPGTLTPSQDERYARKRRCCRASLRLPKESVTQVVCINIPAGDSSFQVIGRGARALKSAGTRFWRVKCGEDATG